MKFILLTLLAAALPLCALADVTGKWSGTIEFSDGNGSHSDAAFLILKQDGPNLSGSGGPSEDHQIPIRNGKVDGNKLIFEVALDDNRVMSFALESSGDELTGNVSGMDKESGEPRKAKMSLKRVAEK